MYVLNVLTIPQSPCDQTGVTDDKLNGKACNNNQGSCQVTTIGTPPLTTNAYFCQAREHSC